MKVFATMILLFMGTQLLGQNRILFPSDWSDPLVFKMSKSPTVRGHGEFSDSLASVYDDGRAFYKHQDKYYSINSWADYYYWYTQKFWFRFRHSADIYELYYRINDDIGMIDFILSQKKVRKRNRGLASRVTENALSVNLLAFDEGEIKKIKKEMQKRQVVARIKMGENGSGWNNGEAGGQMYSSKSSSSSSSSSSSKSNSTNSGKSIAN